MKLSSKIFICIISLIVVIFSGLLINSRYNDIRLIGVVILLVYSILTCIIVQALIIRSLRQQVKELNDKLQLVLAVKGNQN